MSKNPPIVWLLTDQKPGHLNQLRGLAQRLSAQADAQCHFVSTDGELGLMTVWRGTNLAPQLPVPDLIISAGSSTQRALLATKRFFDKPAVVLMRPNFPYAWIDAAIVPEHDNPPIADNVLITQGVLNNVQPSFARAENCPGMMLIGGPSKHYGWNDRELVAQVRTLCQESAQRQWLLSDSRRTPAGFLGLIAEQKLAYLTCVSHTETDSSWLPAQLAQCSPLWVSPDSVSMVYEALTSGAVTGLFNLPSARAGRITRGLEALLSRGRLFSFSHRQQMPTMHKTASFWEADRAAQWLVERFFKDCLT